MELTVDARPPAKIETEALVTYAFEQDKPIEGALSTLDAATGGALSKLASSGELTGKMIETTLVHYPPGLLAQRLLILGAGKRDKFGSAELRKLAGAAVRTLKSKKVKRLAFAVREKDQNAESAQAIVEGILLGNFELEKYKTDK
jgi:leucyl aminopeptidase